MNSDKFTAVGYPNLLVRKRKLVKLITAPRQRQIWYTVESDLERIDGFLCAPRCDEFELESIKFDNNPTQILNLPFYALENLTLEPNTKGAKILLSIDFGRWPRLNKADASLVMIISTIDERR